MVKDSDSYQHQLDDQHHQFVHLHAYGEGSFSDHPFNSSGQLDWVESGGGGTATSSRNGWNQNGNDVLDDGADVPPSLVADEVYHDVDADIDDVCGMMIGTNRNRAKVVTDPNTNYGSDYGSSVLTLDAEEDDDLIKSSLTFFDAVMDDTPSSKALMTSHGVVPNHGHVNNDDDDRWNINDITTWNDHDEDDDTNNVPFGGNNMQQKQQQQQPYGIGFPPSILLSSSSSSAASHHKAVRFAPDLSTLLGEEIEPDTIQPEGSMSLLDVYGAAGCPSGLSSTSTNTTTNTNTNTTANNINNSSNTMENSMSSQHLGQGQGSSQSIFSALMGSSQQSIFSSIVGSSQQSIFSAIMENNNGKAFYDEGDENDLTETSCSDKMSDEGDGPKDDVEDPKDAEIKKVRKNLLWAVGGMGIMALAGWGIQRLIPLFTKKRLDEQDLDGGGMAHTNDFGSTGATESSSPNDGATVRASGGDGGAASTTYQSSMATSTSSAAPSSHIGSLSYGWGSSTGGVGVGVGGAPANAAGVISAAQTQALQIMAVSAAR